MAQYEKHLLRLAEEAEAFGYLAPKVIGREKLEQVAMETPSRFRRRAEKVETPYRRREIVSEYGYAIFQDDPANLHELRQVVSVDGKQIKSRSQARQTLTMGMRGDNDKLKKKMLKDFESVGLRESATDFGQVILLFGKRSQAALNFQFLRNDFIGAERAIVLNYEQKDGDQAMTVFEGRRAVRHKLKGEIWLKETDGVPLRITIGADREPDKNRTPQQILKYAASVDYEPSPHGTLLPATILYNETEQGVLVVENRYQYSEFKVFGASSEIKFTVEEAPPAKP